MHIHLFPVDEDAGMVEDEVPEGVALGVEPGFSTEAGGLEPRELNQGPEGRLTPGHRHSRTRHEFWPTEGGDDLEDGGAVGVFVTQLFGHEAVEGLVFLVMTSAVSRRLWRGCGGGGGDGVVVWWRGRSRVTALTVG